MPTNSKTREHEKHDELTPKELKAFMQLTTSYHEKGREEGIKESILDLLQDKDDYHLHSDKPLKKLEGQTEIETLKKSLRKAAKAPSVKLFLEE
ncbi:MAG: hypothetical protein ACOX6Z_01650 [Dethiobacteria bacterium]|jgi:hypothetical protein